MCVLGLLWTTILSLLKALLSMCLIPNLYQNYLPLKISKSYHMKLLSDRKVVQDLRAYIAGRKFKRIQDLLNIDNGHNVPSYTLQTIEDLSTVCF